MKLTRFIPAALCALALTMGCKPKETQVMTEREELVETARLVGETVSREFDATATLEGYQSMSVAPSIQGRIEHIYVEVGSYVGAGATLIRMDQQQYNTAKLTHSNLKVQMARMEQLLAEGAVSQQSYDEVKLGLDQAEENLRFLEQNTFVKARFAGVISAKNYEDGELYGGQAVLTLTQINVLKALISVPERFYPQIKAGMAVEVKSEIFPDKTFPASIEIVYPTIDPASHTFQCKVKIPNGGQALRPGMYAHTTLALGQSTALLVPYQSVLKLTGSNERYIYINDGGVAKRLFVTTGQRFDDRIEIFAPEIEEGLEVVTTGAEKLVDGVKLKIAE